MIWCPPDTARTSLGQQVLSDDTARPSWGQQVHSEAQLSPEEWINYVL